MRTWNHIWNLKPDAFAGDQGIKLGALGGPRARSRGECARAYDFFASSKRRSAEEMLGKVGQDYRGKADGRFRLDLQTFSLMSMHVKYGLLFLFMFFFLICGHSPTIGRFQEYLRIHIRDGSRCSGTQMRVPHLAGCGRTSRSHRRKISRMGVLQERLWRIPASGSFPKELLFRGWDASNAPSAPALFVSVALVQSERDASPGNKGCTHCLPLFVW